MAEPLFNVVMVGSEELIAKIENMPRVVRQVLFAKMESLALDLESYIKKAKLSGQVLHVVTGALRRSIHKQPTVDDGSMIVASVASSGDVKYASIHEFGGKTSPHDIYPSKAQALSFVYNGKRIFASVVHHPGSKMPERSFMRTGLADLREPIINGMRNAVVQGANQALGRRV